MGKKVISATVDDKLFDEWKKNAEDNCINSSQLIEKLLRDYLRRGKK